MSHFSYTDVVDFIMANDAQTNDKGKPAVPDADMEREREILEELRRAVGKIREGQRSRRALLPADDTVMDLLSGQNTSRNKESGSRASSHSFNAYVVKNRDDLSLREEEYSLASLREQLDRCQEILEHFRAGQVRRGLKGRIANYVALLSHRILNWFITPSIMFDESAKKALCDIATAIDGMQRQIRIIVADVAALRKGSVDPERGDDAHKRNPMG